MRSRTCSQILRLLVGSTASDAYDHVLAGAMDLWENTRPAFVFDNSSAQLTEELFMGLASP